ncbi:MAG: methionyl-tRNA formyltransferase [Bacteroidaceae bacterium]|nr:methionyl-tRNA formyltransferase [Bacteroidaceae bacterium]
MRIIFMGTPDFAVESLKKLVENGQDVVAVVTMPDKAVGRHHEVLQASPVKQYALGQGIPVLQPEKLKDEAFLEQLRSYKADLQVVVAFRMLPEVVWAMPSMGTFNLHAALLPQYRGAAPINWAVINGETETGVTTFFLDHDIDTGRIIHRVPVPIADTDTAGDVHDRLMFLGADLVLRTVKDIEAGNVTPVDQCSVLGDSVAELHPAPKLFRENTEIRWHEHTVKSAYDFIRGLSPYPGAWTTLRTADGKETQLKLFFAEKELIHNSQFTIHNEIIESRADAEETIMNYELLIMNSSLFVPLSDGYLRLTDLQLAGKRRMKAEDFLRGAHLEGAVLVESVNKS